jgi:hypothetical protein
MGFGKIKDDCHPKVHQTIEVHQGEEKDKYSKNREIPTQKKAKKTNEVREVGSQG